MAAAALITSAERATFPGRSVDLNVRLSTDSRRKITASLFHFFLKLVIEIAAANLA